MNINFEDLFRTTRTGSPDPGCDDYYCSTCGGQAGRVEKALKHARADDVYSYLISVDVSKYLRQDSVEEERMFLKHLVEGADWSKPVLNIQQREDIYSIWRKQSQGNEFRQLDAIFEFISYDDYWDMQDDEE